MEGAVPPTSTDSDQAYQGRNPGRRLAASRFMWVSSSPTPAEVVALEQSFPEVIQVPPAALDLEARRWESNVVLARSLHRWIPPDAIIREFQRAGVAGEIAAVSLAHRCYIFRFSESTAKELVLGRPWVVNGQPIATAEWEEQFIPAPDSLPSALIWLRLPNLPIEFWNDDILRTILAPAGRFVASDAPTKEKSRGGFARACVSIDLGRPLRPGARVRGNQAPFWQQFVYEHVEGICPSCGSIHLHGSCSRIPDAEPSSARSSFGPWMAALRQRRPPDGPPADLRRKAAAASSQPGLPPRSVPDDGWQLPKKTTRRNLPKSSRPQRSPGAGPSLEQGKVSAAEPVEDGVLAGTFSSPRCSDPPILVAGGLLAGTSVADQGCLSAGKQKGKVALGDVMGGDGMHCDVPFSAGCAENEVCAESECGLVTRTSNVGLACHLNSNLQAKNPFALLGSAKWAGRPSVRKDANPGPAKRARPAEAQSHRVVSKTDKKIGKKIPSGSVIPQGQFTFSAGPAASLPCVTLSDKGAQPTSECAQPNDLEGKDHDSVVVSLKDAISRQAQVSRDAACSMQVPEGSNQAIGSRHVNGMVEDLVGSLPPPSM